MATVLVVDDFADIRVFLTGLLERAGHQPVEAQDGAEALELARKVKPALVISDVMMPTMDGFEFTRRLRANPELANIPVILVSAAYHKAETANLAVGLNVARILTKPLNVKETVAAVHALLGGSGPVPEAAPPHSHLDFLARLDAPMQGRRLVDIIAAGEELARAASPGAVLETLTRRVRDLLGTRAAFAVVTDPVARRFLHTASAGWSPEVSRLITGSYPESGALRALFDGGPAIRAGGRDLNRLAPHWPADAARTGCLGLRMSSPAFPSGALILCDALAGDFSAEDEQLAVVLAAQGAVAFEKSMLLVEARQRAHDLDSEIQRTRAAEARLQVLSRRLVQVQEEERRNLARELHDEIGQLLTGFKLKLEAVASRAPAEVSGQLGGMLADARELIGRTRDLSLDLRPSMLDDLGLEPAVLWHVERFGRQSGLKISVVVDVDRRFPGELEIAAYRIMQESLTNAARHSGSPDATVHIFSDERALTVSVSDTGHGFDPAAPMSDSTSSGLTGMSERAAALGGRLMVTAAPGQGTTITAVFPL